MADRDRLSEPDSLNGPEEGSLLPGGVIEGATLKEALKEVDSLSCVTIDGITRRRLTSRTINELPAR